MIIQGTTTQISYRIKYYRILFRSKAYNPRWLGSPPVLPVDAPVAPFAESPTPLVVEFTVSPSLLTLLAIRIEKGGSMDVLPLGCVTQSLGGSTSGLADSLADTGNSVANSVRHVLANTSDCVSNSAYCGANAA